MAPVITPEGILLHYRCEGLTSLTLPDGIQKIWAAVFSHCTSLTSVALPQGLLEIGAKAFLKCTSLTSITFPEGLLKIGHAAFWHAGLTSVALPHGIRSGAEKAFTCLVSGFDAGGAPVILKKAPRVPHPNELLRY